MAYTLVQEGAAASITSPSMTATLTNAPTTGDLVVIDMIILDEVTPTATALPVVADSNGNMYTTPGFSETGAVLVNWFLTELSTNFISTSRSIKLEIV